MLKTCQPFKVTELALKTVKMLLAGGGWGRGVYISAQRKARIFNLHAEELPQLGNKYMKRHLHSPSHPAQS